MTISYVEEKPSFVKKSHELDKLLKKLSKESDGAVDFLREMMEDKTIDTKYRIDCASKIIAFQMETAKDINTENIQRLVAEIKMKGPTQLVPQNKTPLVDFNTIRVV